MEQVKLSAILRLGLEPYPIPGSEDEHVESDRNCGDGTSDGSGHQPQL